MKTEDHIQGKEKVILDTDIGSDIDDAVCLAYLLTNPSCELLGITTVTGEGELRARMASALCQIAGKDVPIYIGAEKPLLVDQKQATAPQAAALSRWTHETGFPRGEAIQFMRSTIRANPGQVTLLTIGPLTNAALLFIVDPEIPSMLRQLVMMCGAFENNRLEWNAMLDPHATEIVYRSKLSIHRSIGTDVTRRVTLPAAEVRAHFQSPLLKPVLDFAEIWFKQTKQLTFHDPLAATTVFNNEICQFTRGKVTTQLTGKRSLGKTHWKRISSGHNEVATSVDPRKFFEHFFSVLNS